MVIAGESTRERTEDLLLIILAGTPTATLNAGTSSKTIEQAPICAPSPTLMFPSRVHPAPRRTPSPIVGCRIVPLVTPVPPKVTLCNIETLSPTTAVSPITTPVPWSMKTPDPSLAPGWMSILNTAQGMPVDPRAK